MPNLFLINAILSVPRFQSPEKIVLTNLSVANPGDVVSSVFLISITFLILSNINYLNNNSIFPIATIHIKSTTELNIGELFYFKFLF